MSKQQEVFLRKVLFERFDDIIDDILADPGSQITPQDAVELSDLVAIVNVEREAAGRELVVLPPWIHLQVNECAKRGMRKGRGRKGKPKRPLIKLIEDLVLTHAKESKYELKRSDPTKTLTDAEYEAAEAAEKMLRDLPIKLGVERIRRRLSDV